MHTLIYSTGQSTQGTAKARLSSGVCCVRTLSLGSVSSLYHIDLSSYVHVCGNTDEHKNIIMSHLYVHADKRSIELIYSINDKVVQCGIFRFIIILLILAKR